MAQETNFGIKGFLETSFLDWPGQIASVLFLGGCNFRCPFCHNHGLVLNPQAFPDLDWSFIRSRLAKHQGWIDGVVISGGEPTLSPGLPRLVREIKKLGFQIKLDTNGSRPEVLQTLLDEGLLAHVAMDIKAPLDEFSYARAAGRPGFLDPVKKSLEILQSFSPAYTLRTTVVPSLHSERDVLTMAEQLHGAPEWKLQNFNPQDALDCSYRDIPTFEQDFFDLLSAKASMILNGAA